LDSSLYQTVIFWVTTKCSAVRWHPTLQRYKLPPSSQFHHNVLKSDTKIIFLKKQTAITFFPLSSSSRTIHISHLNYAHSTLQASNNEWQEDQDQYGNRLGRTSGRIMWWNIKQKLWNDKQGWRNFIAKQAIYSGNAEKRSRSRWLLSFKVLMGISVQTLVLWVATLCSSESGYHNKMSNMLPSHSLTASSTPLKIRQHALQE
jgi:hypothetical protein